MAGTSQYMQETGNRELDQEISNQNSMHRREQFQQASSQLTCKVCLENVVGIIFLPCSHLVCCVPCAGAMSQCPICRAQVSATIKVNI